MIVSASVPTTPPATPPKQFFGQPNRSPVPYASSETNNKTIPKPTWGQQSNQKTVLPEEPTPKFQLKKDPSHKDVQNRYCSVPEKTAAPKAPSPSFGAIPGVVNRAKEGLAVYGTNRIQQKSPSVREVLFFRDREILIEIAGTFKWLMTCYVKALFDAM